MQSYPLHPHKCGRDKNLTLGNDLRSNYLMDTFIRTNLL